MRIGLAVLLCLTFGMVDAQVYNYVPNPQFELMDSCPNELGRLDYLKQWFNTTYNTPDAFNACSNFSGAFYSCGVPLNYLGHQSPRSGNGYVGIGSVVGNGRDYISVRLKQDLIADSIYCVTAWVSRAPIGGLAIGCIGFYFSPLKITVPDEYAEVVEVSPQVLNPTSNYLVDTIEWMQITGSFTAQGGERYLTIGNFFDDTVTQYLLVHTAAPYNFLTYYYIDDVSVTARNPNAVNALVAKQTIQVYPNPASTEITVTFPSNKTATLQIVDAIGRAMYSVETDSHQPVIDVCGFPNGLYFLKLTDPLRG